MKKEVKGRKQAVYRLSNCCKKGFLRIRRDEIAALRSQSQGGKIPNDIHHWGF